MNSETFETLTFDDMIEQNDDDYIPTDQDLADIEAHKSALELEVCFVHHNFHVSFFRHIIGYYTIL